MRFRQSTNLRVSFELFQCGLKSQSEYEGDGLFAFCLQRAYDRTGSKVGQCLALKTYTSSI